MSSTLEQLATRSKVTRGAFRPAGAGQEWVDIEVLRRLRRRSLAILRSEIEAVDPARLAAFSPAWQKVGSTGGGPGRLLETVRRLQGAAIPASILERDVLPSRLAYTPDLLDALAATGEVVWVGRGPLGSRDGRIGLYLRDQIASLAWPLDLEAPDSAAHGAIREYLAARGASFFRDLYAAAGGGDPEDALAAVWDLVWAGEVTNDTLAPLRAHLWGRARRAGGRRARLPTTASPPAGSGRWYLVSELLRDTPSATVTAAARAEALLERYGIVVRDAVLAESVPGGFAGLYPVLTAFEEAGRVRRGYFVEGRGGSQFALPGALDRLRSLDASSDSPPTALAAADPANAYGAAIPWPQHRSGRASRSAGAYVILCEGRLAAFVERGGRTVLTFDDHDPSVVAAGLAELGRSRIPRLVVATIDGEAAASTAVGSALLGGGFTESYKGLASRRA